MNRFALGLLASTSLTFAGTTAFADVVFQDMTGFGSSSASPTIVPDGDTLYVGNLDQATPAWFEVAATGSTQSIQIQFTAARLRVLGGQEGSSAVSPVDTLGSEGSSLPVFQGTPGIIPGSFTGPGVTAQIGPYVGSSYPSAFQPVLDLMIPGPEGEGSSAPVSFAQVVPPAFVAGYEGNAGAEGNAVSDSYVVDLVLQPGEALPFSFTYDFDYTLEVQAKVQPDVPDQTPVPEPASAALFGVGLAAIAAVRRRRRGGVL